MSGTLWSRTAGPEEAAGMPARRSARAAEGRLLGRHRGPAVRAAVRWLPAGVVVGVLWRLLTPLAESRVESWETTISGDVTFALLAAAAGLVVAVLGLLRSGPGSTLRFTGALVCSGAASGVAWGVGRVLGVPALRMPSVLLLWPLSLALVTVLVSLVATLFIRDSEA